MNYIPFYVVLTLATLMVCMFLIWRDSKKHGLNAILKGASSFGFMVLGLVSAYSNQTFTLPVLFFLIGLTASIFGDLFLAWRDVKNENETMALYSGFISFSIAQVFYILAIAFYFGFSWWSIVIGLGLALMVVLGERLLKLDFGKMRIMVAVYAVLLMTTLGSAIMAIALSGYSLFVLLVLLGAIMFAASDLILSFIYFRKDGGHPSLVYFNLATYYIAQILIASALMFI